MSVVRLPPASDRRYIRLARELAKRIADGEFAPGDRLPPERELAVALQVSRNTVREALLALELMRRVEIRLGAGVFVLDPPEEPGDEGEPDEAGPFEIVEMRRTVEGDAARKAAIRMPAERVQRLWAAHRRMQAALDDVPSFDRADRVFHALIAEGSGNALIERAVRDLWGMRHGPMWRLWYGQTRSRRNRERSVADHERIARAIDRRLPDAAETAMHAHIDVLADRFFELDLEPAAPGARTGQL
jgi:DNA-binding FadR family transcriptional regulator